MKIIDVTLLGIAGGNADPVIKIMDETISIVDPYFNFKKSVIITDKDINTKNHQIKKVAKLDYAAFNLFCILDLWRYVETPHFLIIQPDGFIINPQLWDDNWLNYDFIGAPLNDPKMNLAIGNGGFSLRTKSLAKFISQKNQFVKVPLIFNEDGYYSNLLNNETHLKYPTVIEALHFSQEWVVDKNIIPFGIHGAPYSTAFKLWVQTNKQYWKRKYDGKFFKKLK